VKTMTQLEDGRDGTQRELSGRVANSHWQVGSTSRGSPEGRFLAGAGKALHRQISELKERLAAAKAQLKSAAPALDHAVDLANERRAQHRGGDRPWPVRLIIPVAIVAEALTAFVAMEALVSSVELAVGLAIMAALVGAGTACMIANRRLNRLQVPVSARLLEAGLVAVLTELRFQSLDLQSATMLTAAGGAALAALISAIALLAIEEVVVETDTSSVCASRLRVWFRRRQLTRASSRVARYRARVEAAGDKFQQHFLDFLLKSEGLSLDQAQRRTEAFENALVPAERGDS
jgi:hypothetical protein